MASRTIHVPDIGDVAILRKKGVRSMRLRVDPNGTVRLTIPWWVHTKIGLQFLLSKSDWIREQQKDTGLVVTDGMEFGDNLVVRIVQDNVQAIKSTWKPPILTIKLPVGLEVTNATAQEWMQKALFRRLRVQAEEKLLPRLQFLADLYDFDFTSSSVRKLKARWGSCTSKKEITLNAYLAQLPEELIDYVLIHELVHTKHLHHGKAFWEAVHEACPDYKTARKAIKSYQPRLYPTNT